MLVSVMDVRPVSVDMSQGFMGMAVIVDVYEHYFFMFMQVMFIMEMWMPVKELIMGVEMSVSLVTENEYPPQHEYGGNPIAQRGSITENCDG